MRPIKFRGLRVDGKGWVYGDYIQTKPFDNGDIRGWIQPRNKFGIVPTPTSWHAEVVPESVGQFTGLYDCTKWEDATKAQRKGYTKETWKGVEIYAGDITRQCPVDILVDVYTEDNADFWDGEVMWYDYGWAIEEIGRSELSPNVFSELSLGEIKVIGNTTQNPELKEVVDE